MTILPRLLVVKLIWRAGARVWISIQTLQLLIAAGVGAQLAIGQRAAAAAISENPSMGKLTPLIVTVALITVCVFSAAASIRERQRLLGELTQGYVEKEVLRALASAELQAFDDPTFNERALRLRTMKQRPLDLVLGLSGVLGSLTVVIGGMVGLAIISPVAIPVVLVVVLPAWLLSSRTARSIWQLELDVSESDRRRDYLTWLLSDRGSAKEVRSWQCEEYLLNKHAVLLADRVLRLRSAITRRTRYAVAVNVAIGASVGIALFIVGTLVVEAGLSGSEALLTLVAVGIVGGRLAHIGYSIGLLEEGAHYAGDFFEFTEQERRDQEPDTPDAILSNISVEHVTFRYPGSTRTVLNDVSIKIGRGEMAALVGRNGSGKSTLAKVLSGLYAPDSGQIVADGKPVVDRTALRRAVSVLFQDFGRLALTARENITIGKINERMDDTAIWESLSTAQAARLVSELPEGLETFLAAGYSNGYELSMGQWQRLALARTYFRESALVILDEPSAFLDTEAEREFVCHIRRTLRDTGALIITHHLPAAELMDWIYVMSDGRIIEQGRHVDLVEQRGHYWRLLDDAFREEPLARPAQ